MVEFPLGEISFKLLLGILSTLAWEEGVHNLLASLFCYEILLKCSHDISHNIFFIWFLHLASHLYFSFCSVEFRMISDFLQRCFFIRVDSVVLLSLFFTKIKRNLGSWESRKSMRRRKCRCAFLWLRLVWFKDWFLIVVFLFLI